MFGDKFPLKISYKSFKGDPVVGGGDHFLSVDSRKGLAHRADCPTLGHPPKLGSYSQNRVSDSWVLLGGEVSWDSSGRNSLHEPGAPSSPAG